MQKKIFTSIAMGAVLILAVIISGYAVWQYQEINKEKERPTDPKVTEKRELDETKYLYYVHLSCEECEGCSCDLEITRWFATEFEKFFVEKKEEIVRVKKSIINKCIPQDYRDFTNSQVSLEEIEKIKKCISQEVETNKEYLSDSEIAGWITHRDEANGFKFKYPEELSGNNYVQWFRLSKIIVGPIDQDFQCKYLQEEASSLSDGGYGWVTQKEVTINNNTYCELIMTSFASATIVSSYKYITVRNNKQLTVEFSEETLKCHRFTDGVISIKECEEDIYNFNPVFLVDQILSTFRFLE